MDRRIFYFAPHDRRLFEVHSCMRETFDDLRRAARMQGIEIRRVQLAWVMQQRLSHPFAYETVMQRPALLGRLRGNKVEALERLGRSLMADPADRRLIAEALVLARHDERAADPTITITAAARPQGERRGA